MKKLKERLKAYIEKNSWWRIAGDVIFYVFIILMLIPATRKPIATTLIKATMRKPRVVAESAAPELQAEDYKLEFEDMEGNITRLEDLKDEVILLNYWATWCPPCRAEMPSLQALYNDYSEKIRMILVTNEDSNTITQFLESNGYDLPVYIQKTNYAPSFQVNSIPTTFLIARNGRIVTSKTGAANWNSESFRQELDELISE